MILASICPTPTTLSHYKKTTLSWFLVAQHNTTQKNQPLHPQTLKLGSKKMHIYDPKGTSLSLTEEQLKAILKRYDTNGDGKLSRKEPKVSFRSLGLRFSGLRARCAIHHFFDQQKKEETLLMEKHTDRAHKQIHEAGIRSRTNQQQNYHSAAAIAAIQPPIASDDGHQN
ncbi:hypothetical protein HYC85_020482 [Camellia sinensis]|uniref:EF-hand domain-containing protein n=1 Tax=Camellia sinensis TaxID=4442 RepID=A0A7J7GQ64_CAMSI|nr:hypothetical protein HYC85_020482 [Camellia sinensis]